MQTTDKITEMEKRLAELEQKQMLDSKKITALENTITEFRGTTSPQLTPPVKERSIGEFLMTLHPNGDTDKALYVAYYLEVYRSLKEYTVEELEDAFRESKESIPSNMNDKVYMNVKKAFMMEGKNKMNGKKVWCLTNTGLKRVQDEMANKSKA